MPGLFQFAVVRAHEADADFTEADGPPHELFNGLQDEGMADDCIELRRGDQGVVVAGLGAAASPSKRHDLAVGAEELNELPHFVGRYEVGANEFGKDAQNSWRTSQSSSL